MNGRARRWAWGTAIAAFLSCPALADAPRSMARQLSRAARRCGVRRVAVLPFASAEDSASREGWAIAERLLTQLAATGSVQTLERTMIQGLLDEQRLGRTGAVDAATIRRLGRLLSAEAVVTGSFVALGRDMRVEARLIDVETGVILGACESLWPRSLPAAESADWSAGQELVVPAPEFIVDAPPLPPEPFPELHDAPAELQASSCDDAAERVDALERQVLELKARYWARKLREGLPAESVKVNPGSTISDDSLRRAFYERLKQWYSAESVPALSAAEVRRFIALDGKAYHIHSDCGL